MAKKKKKATTKKAMKKTAKKTTKKTVKKAVKRVAKKATAKKTGAAVRAPSVRVGGSVPAFALPATGGKQVTSETLKGKKIVLYFYPKDATPGCTLEGHDFTRLHNEFEKTNTAVFGISRDDLNSHEKFKSKEGFCFDLLSDEKGELSELFGVWKEKNNYGKKYMGIERSTFVIDENGILRKEWRKVKVDGHAQEVLNTVKAL